MNKTQQRDGDHPVNIQFHDDMIWVILKDGRVIGAPLDWFPWLAEASIDQRVRFEVHPFSVTWPDLDDGIDIQAFVTGHWTTPMDASLEEASR